MIQTASLTGILLQHITDPQSSRLINGVSSVTIPQLYTELIRNTETLQNKHFAKTLQFTHPTSYPFIYSIKQPVPY